MSQQSFHQQTATGADINFTIDTFESDEIKVYVDGDLKTAGNDYNINPYNTNSQSTVDWIGTAPTSPSIVRIVRETDVLNAGNTAVEGRAEYQAGASVKADDLNNNQKQVLRALQEHNDQLIQRYDIEDGEVIRSKIAADAIDSTKIADNSINSEHYVDGSIDHVHLANDIIDGDNIQNDVINSEHYVAGSIDLEHMSANSVDSDQYVDGSIDLVHMSANSVDSDQYVDGSIDRVHLAADIVDGTKIADDSIDSEHYVDGSIDTAHIANSQVTTAKIAADAITGAKIADDAIDSEHYTDGSIDTAHIANSAVTANKIADGTVGTLELANSSVTTAKIADANVTTAKIADSAITNAKINNLAVGNSKIYPQAVTYDKIATATIISGNIANGNIITDKIADNAVTTAKIASNSVTNVEIATATVLSGNIADGNINSAKIQDNAVTIDKIADAAIVTNSEQASHSVDDNTFFTTAAAEARYFNASTGETIKDGQTFPDNDTTIATTAAINDRIIDLVDEVGGFHPVANEAAIPGTNVDIDNNAGTIVSIGVLSNTYTPSGGTATIPAANLSNLSNNLTITGCGTTVLEAGYGLLLETKAQTDAQFAAAPSYTFHRLVPKATEVTTVAGKATEIGRLGTADAVADMAILGTADVVSDLNTLGTADVVADMNMLAVSDVISDMNTLAVTSVINDMDTVATNVSNVNTTAGSISNVNTTAGSISNVNTVAGSIANVNTVGSAISNVNTTAGSISNVNSVASNMANVNNFADRYQIAANNPSTDGGGNALAAGDLYFNTSANELKIYNGSSWQAGVTATGNFALTTGNTFTGDNRYNDSVKALFGTGSDLEIFHDNNGDSNIINNTGHLTIRNNTAGKIINLQPKAAENGIIVRYDGESELYYDNSKKLHTTSTGVYVTGNITLPDDGEAKFGNSGDLAIYHNDSLGSSWIANSTGELNIRSDSIFLRSQSDAASYINCTDNGSVDLYYNGTKKLETTNNGIDVDGNVTADDIITAGALLHEGDTDTLVHFSAANTIQLKTGGSSRLLANNSGVSLENGNLNVNGNRILIGDSSGSTDDRLCFGESQDLQIYHDGNNSVIEDTGTGSLIAKASTFHVKSTGGEDVLKGITDGAVELYYDSTKMLSTESRGAILQKADGCTFIVGSTNAGTAQIFLDGDSNGDGNGGDYAFLRHSTSGHLEIGADNPSQNASIQFMTGAATHVANLDSSGHFYPQTDSTHDIGISSKRWRNLYADTLYGDGSNLTGINTDLVGDTSPQLGGDLDLNGNSILLDDNEKIFIGTSNDGSLFNTGSYLFLKNHSGGVAIQGTNTVSLQKYDNADIGLQYVVDGQVKLYYDNSLKFETTSGGVNLPSGNFTIPDSGGTGYGRLVVGSGSDLQMYHNGSNSYLTHDGAGDFYIQTTQNNENLLIAGGQGVYLYANGSENAVACVQNGAVSLYYDNSKKFETTSAGAQVTGTLNHLGGSYTNGSGGYVKVTHDSGKFTAGAGDDLEMYHDGSNSYLKHNTTSGDLILDAAAGTADIRMKARNHLYVTTNDTESAIEAYANSGVHLYYDTAEKFKTTSGGAQVTGSLTITNNLVMGDSDEIKLGASSDMTIWHNGTDFNLYNSTGEIIFANASGGGITFKTNSNNTRAYLNADGHFYPASNNSFDLGTTSNRWRNVFTNDLHLSNKGHTNDVDGTWGDWTIQEGESDLFLKNNRSGKKYKFNLMEVS